MKIFLSLWLKSPDGKATAQVKEWAHLISYNKADV